MEKVEEKKLKKSWKNHGKSKKKLRETKIEKSWRKKLRKSWEKNLKKVENNF